MEQPEPQGPQFEAVMGEINNGIIKIPQFQRDFVWTKTKSAKLLDSMIRGYPIGTFILWKTKERLRSVRNIGNANLPATPDGDYAKQVLDGQQRLTSLYAAMKGLRVERGDKNAEDFSEIFIDLSVSGEDDDIVTTDATKLNDGCLIKITDLMEGPFSIITAYPKEYHERLDNYRSRLKSYAFSVVLVKGAPIDVATEIFTRINTGGQRLSVFEIMVAKTFDSKRNFDLSEKYAELVDQLDQIEYGTIPDSVVLQSVAAIMVGAVKSKEILKLDRKSFVDAWDGVTDAMQRAAEYFRNAYRIPVSALLPYQSLMVPFTYFFFHHKDKPVGEMGDRLQDFFWRTSLTSRYSRSAESQIEADLRRIDSILSGSLPKYEVPVDTSAKFIDENGYFRVSRAYIKAILCLFAYQEPKSFVDDSQVQISNAWLKRANSKNYHHFFPRAFLAKTGEDEWYVNHVANITIVDDFLNKRLISAKAPATYMKQFAKKNPGVKKTMESHLIDLDSFGVWENDYDVFFNARCEAIAAELKKRIILQPVDERQQAAVEDAEEDDSI